MQGFIKLHRKIQDHWLYQEERKFSRYEAWLDLIMMANHKQTKVLLGNELVQAQRGQVITSEAKLMKKWKWGKSRLRTFLEILENDGMIIKKSDRKKTVINIENYCIYHDKKDETEPPTDHKQTDNKPQSDTIKNDKNVKNEEEDIPYSEIVSYLNDKANKKYKASTPKTKQSIHARWEQGFRLSDFKQVIDIKVNEWTNTDMEKYIRPETLFGTKFEGYLNQETTEKREQKTEEPQTQQDKNIQSIKAEIQDLDESIEMGESYWVNVKNESPGIIDQFKKRKDELNEQLRVYQGTH